MPRHSLRMQVMPWPLNTIRAAIVVLTLFALVFGWSDMLRSMDQTEAATVERARHQARGQAKAVGELVQARLDSLDLAIRSVRAAVSDGHAAIERQTRLALQDMPSNFVLQLFIIDHDGYLSYSSLGPSPRNYLGDRDYYARLAHAEDDILVVSEPVLGRLTQRWSIQVARAIRDNGVFAGVVSIAVSVETWAETLAQLEPGRRDTLTLVGRDGELLMRTLSGPEHYGKQLRLRRDFIDQPALMEGDYLAESVADGVSRIFGWSRLSSGLVMVSGLALDDVLAPVRKAREQAITRGVFLSIFFLLAVSGLLYALARSAQAMRRLAVREARTRNLVDNMAEGIMVVDDAMRIVASNPALCEISGHTEEVLHGASPAMLCGETTAADDLLALLDVEGEDMRGGDFVGMRPDGARYIAHARVTRMSSDEGGRHKRLVLVADVTESRREADDIWRRANFDMLTGLPNRALLLDRLERMILHARREGSEVIALFVDLDLFKPINDRFGHAFGDRLLCQVARRLEQLFRSEDTVGRLGGDEFVVLIPASPARDLAGQSAQKLVDRLSEPFEIDGEVVSISASVGVAFYPRDAETPAELIGEADAAMYRAKHAGRATWRA